MTTVLAGAGLLGGHALADTVPIPTVPTVTVPTVTVPTVTVPALPVPVPAPPVTVPAPPTTVPLPTNPTLPTPALPAAPTGATLPGAPAVSSSVGGSTLGGASVAGSTAGGGGSAGSPSSASAAPGRERPRVERFRSSRSWIATSGPKGRRVTTLTFVLPHAARVVFVVKQLSPLCRIAGHFAVNGHPGRNRIRFPGRGSKLQLDPGTYRITARTRAGQLVQRVTIVVVEAAAPTRDQIIAARTANVCTPANALAAAGGSTGASNTGDPSVQGSFTAGQPSASGPSESGNSHSGGVLASSVERAARAARPVVIALLALAIVLLAVASLPRPALLDSRANEILTRHRMEIAAMGTATFAAVVIVLLLG